MEASLASSAQEVQYAYTRNQLRELKTASWSNNAYGWTPPAPGTQNYTANGLNQYTAAAGSALSYDASGNLASDGAWLYGYDLDNRLTSASKSAAPAVSAALSYDAQGRLRQTTIGSAGISLLYDGQRLLAEYDSTSGALLRKYVHGPGTDEPLVWYEGAGTAAKGWLYADHLGSIVAVANSAGASTATYSYGPWGEPDTLAGAMRFRYTGQQLIGELGLYHYKARAYSPALGRFLQTDPIGYADDMNLYAYVGGNPANRTDPSGLQADSVYAPGGNKGVIVSGDGNSNSVLDESYQVAGGPNKQSIGNRDLQVLEGGGGLSGAGRGSWYDGIGSGSRPQNYSPEGASRNGALNEAQRLNGIPTSQQPSSVTPNVDLRGNPQPGRQYTYEVPAPGGGQSTELKECIH